MFTATVSVTLKDSIQDPQGTTGLHALSALGFTDAVASHTPHEDGGVELSAKTNAAGSIMVIVSRRAQPLAPVICTV